MRKSEVFFRIVLALGTIILSPVAAVQADEQEEGPFKIEKCQTISQQGSYKLVNNLTFSPTTSGGAIGGTCLTITASFVTIDLAGFTITGPGPAFVFPPNGPTGIVAGNDRTGIAVRDGTISGFFRDVDLGSDGSIVEGLRVFGGTAPATSGYAPRGS